MKFGHIFVHSWESLHTPRQLSLESSIIQIGSPDPICEEEIIIEEEMLQQNQNYQAEDWIEIHSTISSQMDVNLQAGNSITLNPGFQVESNGQFLANIEDIECEEAEFEEYQVSKLEIGREESYTSGKSKLIISPNPFLNTTKIQYYLSKETEARVRIYSIAGVLLEEIVTASVKESGFYEATFSATNYTNNIFFVELVTEETVIVKKMIPIK